MPRVAAAAVLLLCCSVTFQQNGTNGLNGMNGGSNGMQGLNGLNAAALALHALAAANPALLLSQNPWLASQVQQQLLGGMPGVSTQTSAGAQLGQNPFGANMGTQQQGSLPVMDTAQFAQHLAAGQHLNGASGEKQRA